MNDFVLKGVVTPFAGDGRRLGYPTANIVISSDTPEGLFTGFVELNGDKLPSIIFIGAPVTMGETERRAEAHILDFEDRDLYGEEVVFCVEHKLRENRPFDTVNKLIQQMKRDEANARKYFERTRGDNN